MYFAYVPSKMLTLKCSVLPWKGKSVHMANEHPHITLGFTSDKSMRVNAKHSNDLLIECAKEKMFDAKEEDVQKKMLNF